jgi:hypothetical protein
MAIGLSRIDPASRPVANGCFRNNDIWLPIYNIPYTDVNNYVFGHFKGIHYYIDERLPGFGVGFSKSSVGYTGAKARCEKVVRITKTFKIINDFDEKSFQKNEI